MCVLTATTTFEITPLKPEANPPERAVTRDMTMKYSRAWSSAPCALVERLLFLIACPHSAHIAWRVMVKRFSFEQTGPTGHPGNAD